LLCPNAGNVEADEWLKRQVDEHKRLIPPIHYPDPRRGRPLNANAKSTSFDRAVKQPGRSRFAILDELHLWPSRHFCGEVIGQIRGGMIYERA